MSSSRHVATTDLVLRLEERAAASPDEIAVISPHETLTYRQLHTRANQLAHHLLTLGAGPEVVIGVHTATSTTAITAFLATLKTQAIYLPLDDQHPTERLAHMARDANAHLILCDNHTTPRAQALNRPTVNLDTTDTTTHPTTPPPRAHLPNPLMYIVYTSGSTGTPKGITAPQSTMANAIDALLSRSTRPMPSPQLTSIGFDVALWEIFCTLLVGGPLVLVDQEDKRDLTRLLDVLRREQVGRVYLSPALLQQLAHAWELQSSGVPLPLKELMVSGEALRITPSIRRFLAEAMDGAVLENQYGPSETHMATALRLEGDVSHWPEQPSIGFASPGVTVRLLDEGLRPVPDGVAGEIYIAGPGLARGYTNPHLTAQRFVADPYNPTPGSRMYRTGDLARKTPNGELHFLGRTDHQIKIRGYRIEPAEIEIALTHHPHITQAHITTHTTAHDSTTHLVAYIVTNTPIPPSTEELRHHLTQHLPPYMLPTTYITLDTLPLNANGKIDHTQLPPPTLDRTNLETPYTPPQTPQETLIHTIWTELLPTQTIGTHDNFFTLGGHSLTATQLASRLTKTFDTPIPVRTIFENPTITQLAQAIGTETVRRSNASSRITPGHGPAVSFAQRRLWFLDRLVQDPTVYNAPTLWRIDGPLSVTVLSETLREIWARHDALRVTFEDVEGEPAQRITAPSRVPLPVTDLSRYSPSEALSQVHQIAEKEARLPFDLTLGPLMRARLMRVDADQHFLLLVFHHTVIDAWSMTVLWREFSEIYTAFADGRPSPLQPLPVQYADYAAWQRSWLTGDEAADQLRFWQGLLKDAPLFTDLPTDHPRPAVPTGAGAHVAVDVPQSTVAKLRHLAAESGATLFMVLLAAYQVTLSRYAGTDDVVIGVPMANRTQRETDGLIGFFVNSLPLRLRRGERQTFRELVGAVREVALDAHQNQQIPFELLVDKLVDERDLSRNPLFQVWFDLDSAPQPSMPAGLRIASEPPAFDTTRFDLEMLLEERDGCVRGMLRYSTDLFESRTIHGFTDQFLQLVDEVTTAPDRPVSDLGRPEPEQLRQSLVAGIVSEDPAPPIDDLVLRLEERAAASPDEIAVISPHETLTYRQLHTRANQLAHHLLTLGAGPEVVIGVHTATSTTAITAFLATLKTQAIYLPLDDQHPTERLAHMARDANAHLILCDNHTTPRAQALNRPTVNLDTTDTTTHPITPPPRAHLPNPLMYIVYTSGSTGTPKGIAVSTGTIANLSAWKLHTGLRSDRCLQLSSVGFDVSLQEIVITWLSGGRVVLVDREDKQDLTRLLDLLRREQVGRIYLSPALLQQLAHTWAERPVRLPLVEIIAGGEVLQLTPPIRRLLEHVGDVMLENQYGPSETFHATSLQMTGDSASWPDNPSIGRPISAMRVYVLDEGLRPVPDGVAGEIYIAGPGLARGYTNPHLTAQRFVADPYNPTPGSRMYRTGDLARKTPNGELHFLGRTDHQIKIRGYRIEPAEIEIALTHHPHITQAHITTHTTAHDSTTHLVAYIVTNTPIPPSTEELRHHLTQHLPPYMLPTTYITLDTLPLNANGKIDHTQLPPPTLDRTNLETPYTPPQTPQETLIHTIWTELLPTQTIGTHDNFFTLGGHSLTATQLASRLTKTFDTPIPVRTIFENPTITQLAQAITDLIVADVQRLSADEVKSLISLEGSDEQ
ncbi:amino acid adenylation domain-containing protein [Streptomyces pseudogriseolus]|uniref:amino acid adenylation domain-containing protein n=1 Tax=Streptomyces pseudogriseolus TaxID=36817 RepID=UPI003FA2CD47